MLSSARKTRAPESDNGAAFVQVPPASVLKCSSNPDWIAVIARPSWSPLLASEAWAWFCWLLSRSRTKVLAPMAPLTGILPTAGTGTREALVRASWGR